MPKFYVRSGRFRRVIDRSDARRAAFAAVSGHTQGDGRGSSNRICQLGLITYVSERGFASKDVVDFKTHYLLAPRHEPGNE